MASKRQLRVDIQVTLELSEEENFDGDVGVSKINIVVEFIAKEKLLSTWKPKIKVDEGVVVEEE